MPGCGFSAIYPKFLPHIVSYVHVNKCSDMSDNSENPNPQNPTPASTPASPPPTPPQDRETRGWDNLVQAPPQPPQDRYIKLNLDTVPPLTPTAPEE
jgi:hypothetical protein